MKFLILILLSVSGISYANDDLIFKNTEPTVLPFDGNMSDNEPTKDDIKNSSVQACNQVWIIPEKHKYYTKESFYYGNNTSGRLICENIALALHYKQGPIKKDKTILDVIQGEEK